MLVEEEGGRDGAYGESEGGWAGKDMAREGEAIERFTPH